MDIVKNSVNRLVSCGYSRARGRNVRRDSMGRYSRDGKMMARELRELMEDAPDESIKTEMRRLIQKVESM